MTNPEPFTAGCAVTVLPSNRPDAAFGVITKVHVNASGFEILEITLPGSEDLPEFRSAKDVTLWERPTPWWAEERPAVKL